MTARLIFLGIAIFWLTMNGLLWQAEYGSRGGDTEVPPLLVWQKILTTPDSSSLTVFQNGERMGYCELATSIGREMAGADADKLPSEGLLLQAGYQLHLAGNISLGDFTNRLKFDGTVQFSSPRHWREIQLKLISPQAIVHIHALATNQMLNLRILSGGEVLERHVAFADLQNPEALARSLLGGFGAALMEAMDLPDLTALSLPTAPGWRATRTRVIIGSESLPIYQLQTTVLGREVTVDVSTLGEVLRVCLPGNITAQIDEWKRP
jgi:hypothetical protein